MGKLARGLGVPAQRRCRGSMSIDEQQKRGGSRPFKKTPLETLA